MANFFTNLFSHKGASVLGVDIGSSSIKIVQISKRGGKAVLDTYGELALGPYVGIEVGRATNLPPEKIAQALGDVIRESKTTATGAGLAIPFGSSLITAIEMPSNVQKQFDQMIPLEARKYIPVPISEVALDWWVIPKQAEAVTPAKDAAGKAVVPDKIDVLLVAIHNETLSRYQTIVKDAALDTSFFEIEIFSTIRAIADQETAPELIIDLGAGSTKIYVAERGIVRASHIVNRGAQDVTQALAKVLNVPIQTAEVMKRDMSQVPPEHKADVANVVAVSLDYIFSEAHQVMLNYQRRNNKNVSRTILVGGGAMLSGLLPYAENRLQTKVLLGDPFSKTESPPFLAEILKTTGPEFTVAVGTALRKLQESK